MSWMFILFAPNISSLKELTSQEGGRQAELLFPLRQFGQGLIPTFSRHEEREYFSLSVRLLNTLAGVSQS